MDDLEPAAQLDRIERSLHALTRLIIGAFDVSITVAVYLVLALYEKVDALWAGFAALAAGYLVGFGCRRFVEHVRGRRP